MNHWTQDQLAEDLDVDQGTVSRWERGRQAPDLDMQRQIHDRLTRASAPAFAEAVIEMPVVTGLAPINNLTFTLAISPAAAEGYGLQPEDMVGRDNRHIMHPSTVQVIDALHADDRWIRGEVAHAIGNYERPDGWYRTLFRVAVFDPDKCVWTAGPSHTAASYLKLVLFSDVYQSA